MAKRTDTKPRLRIIRLFPEGSETGTPRAAGDGHVFPPDVEELMRDCRRILAELTSRRRVTSGDDECDCEADDA
jgi:hypothetical protein